MAAFLESLAPGRFGVQGELLVGTVGALWREAGERFAGQPFLRIDLAGVKRADSAGVALLVEWVREARLRGQDLKFTNAPAQVLTIIRTAGLDRVLPLV